MRPSFIDVNIVLEQISKLDTIAEIMDGPIITNGFNLVCVFTVTFQVHNVTIFTHNSTIIQSMINQY